MLPDYHRLIEHKNNARQYVIPSYTGNVLGLIVWPQRTEDFLYLYCNVICKEFQLFFF